MKGFFAIHEGLPREGPGSATSTRHALRLATDLPDRPTVLDVGCGPGAQTMVLAEALPTARILAVDLHQPFVAEVSRRAAAAGVADRVTAVVGDMTDLPAALERLGVDAVDLLWCEGAAYVMGFVEALTAWAPLVRPGGVIALTEPVWLVPTVRQAVRDFWDTAYPAMQPAQVRRAQAAMAGLTRIGDFTLPVTDWEAYYAPIRERLTSLRDDPALGADLAGAIAAHDEELEVFEGGGAVGVGYQFFVLRRPRP